MHPLRMRVNRDIAGIAEAHEEASKSLHMEVLERWDAEFHKRIFASTRNEFLIRLLDILSLIRNRTPRAKSSGGHFRWNR
jgi:DNA-binding FadR family transcriptional regulator